MGLFSDDLNYRDLDALCIKIRRLIGDTVIELPIYVDACISYVTWNNAKEIIIDGSTVKDLKKSGRLLGAFKPIFESYIVKKVNENREYAEYIFPDDFFGEPKLDFSEKRAKELINSKLFKEALTLINDPEGFEEVKFEKIYGIAPVIFKIRSVKSGVSVPYDYSEILKCETTAIEGTDESFAPELTAAESVCESDTNDDHKEQEKNIYPKPLENELDFNALSTEYEELKQKCKIKKYEIETTQKELDGRIGKKESLEKTLSGLRALIEQYKLIPEQIAELDKTIKIEKTRVSQLEIDKIHAVNELESLHKQESTLGFLMDILNHECKGA